MFDDITNEVREVNGEVRIFCANCGDPDGHEQDFTVYDDKGNVESTTTLEIPPSGYGDPAGVMQYWKKATDDTLVCGDPRCLAAVLELDDDELNQMLDDAVHVSNLTEEQVAAMPSPVDTSAELDLSALPKHGEEG